MRVHRGSATAIAVLFLLTTTVLIGGALTLPTGIHHSAQLADKTATSLYTELSVANLSAQAICGQLGQASVQVAYQLGDTNDYALTVLEAYLFPEGRYCDSEKLLETLGFSEGAGLTITLDSPLAMDYGHPDNGENWAMLSQLHFTVTLTQGIRTITQTYVLSGVSAQFLPLEEGVFVTLSTQTASLTKQAQEVKS